VSLDGRNQHPRAPTVTIVPISTTPTEYPSHVPLSIGETGLPENSEAQGENVTVVLKKSLIPPNYALRTLSEATLRKIARAVIAGMGISPNDILK
jgi:mRNA-degrading endonuclease toxin of MazEF toxin-antitoxin module